jgi:hypothetical protein
MYNSFLGFKFSCDPFPPASADKILNWNSLFINEILDNLKYFNDLGIFLAITPRREEPSICQ